MLRRKPRTAIAHYFQAIFTFHQRWFRMRLTGEIMKIITCFKLVPEEQDIVVTPEYTLNFDNADAKISQFDLNAIE